VRRCRPRRVLDFHPSPRDLSQREVLELLVGDQALQGGVLALELLEALDIVGLHPAELGPPAVEGLL